MISCSSQTLPSGSLNDAKEPYVARSGAAPATRPPGSALNWAPGSAAWKVSLTSAPFAARSARAASMSATTRYMFCAVPGAACVMLVPNWTEHGEPGGVYWTIRKPLSKAKSASSRHPSRP